MKRIEAGKAIAALSRELGIKRTVLYRWKYAVQQRGQDSLLGVGRPRKEPKQQAVDQSKQLRQWIAELNPGHGGCVSLNLMAPMSPSILDALLLSWERSHRVLRNLVGALPPGGLEARAAADSPTVSQMLMHLHHERMVSLTEEAPEFAGEVPEREWASERDPQRILALLAESAQRVRDAVRSRIEAGRLTDLNYDHPLLFLQLMMFHDAYHHGQIKLALKLSGCALPDDIAGPLTWDVWRLRKG